MDCAYLSARINLLFPKDLSRLTIHEDGGVSILIDVHGLSCHEARRLITNMVNVGCNMAYTLVIIHGFNRGTAIKDMLANDFSLSRVHSNWPDPVNPGVTYLSIA